MRGRTWIVLALLVAAQGCHAIWPFGTSSSSDSDGRGDRGAAHDGLSGDGSSERRDGTSTKDGPSGPPPVCKWASVLGSTGADYGFGVAVSGGGACYVTGLSKSPADKPVVRGLSASDGTQILDVALVPGTASIGYAYGVVLDTTGKLQVLGGFLGTLTVGGVVHSSKLPTTHDVLVARFISSTGARDWSNNLGGTSQDYGDTIASAGNRVVYGGSFSGQASFGGLALDAVATEGFVASYSTTGTHAWSKAIGGTGDDYVRGVAVDAAGNVCAVGEYDAEFTIDTATISHVGGSDLFVACFKNDGALSWARGFGGAGEDGAMSVALDSTGRVYVTGYLGSPANLGTGQISVAGPYDAFVACFDPKGATTWARGLGGPGDDSGEGIALDAQGRVLVTGLFHQSMTVGTTTLSSKGASDIFVARLSAGGQPDWARAFGGASKDFGRAIAVNASNQICVAGDVGGAAEFCTPGVSLPSLGQSDIFVLRLGP